MKGVRAKAGEDGIVEVLAPGPGYWREAPRKGALITPGASIGVIEVLGALEPLVAPKGAAGIVVEVFEGGSARSSVDFETVLLRLDPNAAGEVAQAELAAAGGVAEGALVFAAPMGGRFYRKPAPDKPAFVEEGQEIAVGDAVCLLEVMKTFNRVQYGGEGLPERAKVVKVHPDDGADLNRGDPILELEAL